VSAILGGTNTGGKAIRPEVHGGAGRPSAAHRGGPGPVLDERRPGRHRLPSAAGL